MNVPICDFTTVRLSLPVGHSLKYEKGPQSPPAFMYGVLHGGHTNCVSRYIIDLLYSCCIVFNYCHLRKVKGIAAVEVVYNFCLKCDGASRAFCYAYSREHLHLHCCIHCIWSGRKKRHLRSIL